MQIDPNASKVSQPTQSERIEKPAVQPQTQLQKLATVIQELKAKFDTGKEATKMENASVIPAPRPAPTAIKNLEKDSFLDRIKGMVLAFKENGWKAAVNVWMAPGALKKLEGFETKARLDSTDKTKLVEELALFSANLNSVVKSDPKVQDSLKSVQSLIHEKVHAQKEAETQVLLRHFDTMAAKLTQTPDTEVLKTVREMKSFNQKIKTEDPRVQARLKGFNEQVIARFSTIPVDTWIEDPGLRELFSTFLKKELSYENMEFCLAVKEFKQIQSPDEQRSKANEIKNTFISADASKEINISSAVKRDLLDKAVSKEVFDKVYKEIKSLVETDTLKRFLKPENFDTAITG